MGTETQGVYRRVPCRRTVVVPSIYPQHFSDRWTISRETSLYPLNPSGYLVVSNACHLSWGGRHHCIRSKRSSASVHSSPRVQKRFSALSERASLCLSLYRASFSSVHHLARGLLIGCTRVLCKDLGAHPTGLSKGKQKCSAVDFPNFSFREYAFRESVLVRWISVRPCTCVQK